jgi:uridine kinase
VQQDSGTAAAVEPVARLLEHLQALPRRGTLFVGVDGPGGSGKSTVARALERLGPDKITVVEMDDFYLPSSERPPASGEGSLGAAFDWRRLLAQVLEPLRAGGRGRYQRYDWDADELAEWHDVPAEGIVVVEGVYSTRSELADHYDFRIWVTARPEVRLARGLERDGEAARSLWVDEWMPEEDRYAALDRPRERAHLVIDGASTLVEDPSAELVVVGGTAFGA